MMSNPLKIFLTLPFICVATGIFVLSSMPQPPSVIPDFQMSDKVLHCIAYFIFGATLGIALFAWRKKIGIKPTVGEMIFILSLAAFYGLSDEFHQSFVPGRDASIWDWFADCLGGLISAVLLPKLWIFLSKILLKFNNSYSSLMQHGS